MGRFSTLSLCALATLTQISSAHFLLHYPTTIGFVDDLETTAPCGSFTPDFSKDNVTDFHVGGDSISLTSIHPQATWLFRATLDQTAGGNFTNLLPAVSQTGLGAYCERDVTVTSSWAGKKGIVQIVQDAPDGILYQCAAVNFVSGSGTLPSGCTNVTGLVAKYTQDAALSSLPATASATASATGSATGSATKATTSTSAAKQAFSTTMVASGGLAAAGWVAVVSSLTMAAYLL